MVDRVPDDENGRNSVNPESAGPESAGPESAGPESVGQDPNLTAEDVTRPAQQDDPEIGSDAPLEDAADGSLANIHMGGGGEEPEVHLDPPRQADAPQSEDSVPPGEADVAEGPLDVTGLFQLSGGDDGGVEPATNDPAPRLGGGRSVSGQTSADFDPARPVQNEIGDQAAAGAAVGSGDPVGTDTETTPEEIAGGAADAADDNDAGGTDTGGGDAGGTDTGGGAGGGNTGSTTTNQAPLAADDTGSTDEDNSKIFDVLANDSDTDSDPLSLAFAEISEGQGSVTIQDGQLLYDPGSAYNSLAAGESAEVVIRYQISDGQGGTSEASLTVSVLGTNDGPVVADASLSVIENAAVGTVIGTIDASDPDTSDSLTYAITSGNDDGAFAIDATTGEIIVADGSTLDHESLATRLITVDVSDGSVTETVSVTINVSNTNEAPSLSVTGSTVAEDVAAGSVVGQATGSDPDAGDSLTYALTDDAGGLFSIDATTGEITIAAGQSLNFESAASHNLIVEVVDFSGLSVTQGVTIDVADVYEDPANEDDAPAVPSGYDYIVLTPGDDAYDAKQGSQYVDALGSDDVVTGGQGADILFGNDGNDQLFGEQGADQLYGGAGDDILDGGQGTDELYGGSGDDSLLGGQGADELYGGSGDDTLLGGQGADTLTGGSGSDTPDGGNQSDTLYGGGGDDTLIGGAGDDVMYDQSGNDTLIGGTGDDIMNGGAGDDLFLIGNNERNDVISGGFGTDSIDLSATGGSPDQGWTVALDNGSQITGQGTDYLDLSGESSGVIIFDDGTEIAFEGIEKVTW